MNLQVWESCFEKRLISGPSQPPSHDILHIRRVVANAKEIAAAEGANLKVVVPAAWLHDFVTLPKNHSQRHKASSLAANKAARFLREAGYPKRLIPNIAQCIRVHSWSAGLETDSIEAAVVQDADRLDAIGAIGIARCFSGTDRMRQLFYNEHDPFAEDRPPDDKRYTVDHFYVKLLGLAETMKTNSARQAAERRCRFMKNFLRQLRSELFYLSPSRSKTKIFF